MDDGNDEEKWACVDGKVTFRLTPFSRSIPGKIYYRRDPDGAMNILLQAHDGQQTYSCIVYGGIEETRPYKPGVHRITKLSMILHNDEHIIVPDRLMTIKAEHDYEEVISSKKIVGAMLGLILILAVINWFRIPLTWWSCGGGLLVYFFAYAKIVGYTTLKSLCTEED